MGSYSTPRGTYNRSRRSRPALAARVVTTRAQRPATRTPVPVRSRFRITTPAMLRRTRVGLTRGILIGMLMTGAIQRLPAQEAPLTPHERIIMENPRLFEYLAHSNTQNFFREVLGETGANIPMGLTPEELLAAVRRLKPSQVERLANVTDEEWWYNPEIGRLANREVELENQARADKNKLKKKIGEVRKQKGKVLRHARESAQEAAKRAQQKVLRERETSDTAINQRENEITRLQKVVRDQKWGIGGAMASGALISWLLFGRRRK